jgi:biopolymer transport protein ExbB
MLSHFFLQASPVNDSIAKAANTIAEGAANQESISYLSFILKGGVLIIPILILLFFCVYVIFEKSLSIKKITKQNQNLVNELKLLLKAGKVSDAVMVCNRENTATSNILRSGIAIIGRPVLEIESMMERTTNVTLAQMEKGLGYLGLISGIAPILGFIGTISGVIKIFYSISITENISIGNISGGLYEKMISSGAGLVVGVVAYSGYHLFNMIIDGYAAKVQQQILEIISTIQEPHGN